MAGQKRTFTCNDESVYEIIIVEKVKILGEIDFVMNVDGKNVRFVVRRIACNVDSVARPLLENRI